MKLNKIAFAVLALASAGSTFAALCTSTPNDVTTLLQECSPDITFVAAGGTAMRDAYKNVAYTFFDNTKPLVYVKTLKSDGTSENKDVFAMYGYVGSTAPAEYRGKRLAVIVNTVNGSFAGVNMLLSAGKTGSLVNGTDGQEYKQTIQLQTAAGMKGGNLYKPAGMVISADAATGYELPNKTKVQSATVLASSVVNDLKLGVHADKNKVVNIAFADVRPLDAVPGQLFGSKWDQVKFPANTLAMQGFQVVVNNNLYAKLIARDVAAGRLASTCTAPAFTATLTAADMACQPTVTSAEMATIMLGKRPSTMGLDAGLGMTLQRRVDSSGTQAATQIFFTKMGNAIASKVQAFTPVMGAALVDGGKAGDLTKVLVVVNSSSDNLVANVPLDTTGYSIGVVSNDKGSYNGTANILSVKVDGFSPNFDGTAIDASAKATLAKGYPVQFEFVSLAPATQAAPQAAVVTMFNTGLANVANAVKGVVYKTQSTFSRNGNNLGALTE
jgi:hypothetical protein